MLNIAYATQSLQWQVASFVMEAGTPSSQPAVRRREICSFASVLGLSFAYGDSSALNAQHVAI